MAEIPTPEEAEAAMLRGFHGRAETSTPAVAAGAVECPACRYRFDASNLVSPAESTRVTE